MEVCFHIPGIVTQYFMLRHQPKNVETPGLPWEWESVGIPTGKPTYSHMGWNGIT